MLLVETIAKIRRAYFPDKKPITRICRELRVSRNTVRRVIRSGATEFSCARSVQPQPKIGPWKDELDRMLAEKTREPKCGRLTRIRIFEELQALEYEGGYDAVRRYASSWEKTEREASAAAYVPLSFDPGEEVCQFDLKVRKMGDPSGGRTPGEQVVLIDGVTTTVKVTHGWLCCSRILFVRTYPLEAQMMVFDAHDAAFAFAFDGREFTIGMWATTVWPGPPVSYAQVPRPTPLRKQCYLPTCPGPEASQGSEPLLLPACSHRS